MVACLLGNGVVLNAMDVAQVTIKNELRFPVTVHIRNEWYKREASLRTGENEFTENLKAQETKTVNLSSEFFAPRKVDVTAESPVATKMLDWVFKPVSGYLRSGSTITLGAPVQQGSQIYLIKGVPVIPKLVSSAEE